MNRVVEAVGDSYKKAEAPEFHIGDTVDVHVRIKEGDRERVQVFNGTVIARRGRGVNEAFTVRHVFQGEGVERVFPVHCPSIEKIDVKRRGRIRRAKLYYLRERSGRGARLTEQRSGPAGGESGAPPPAKAPKAGSTGSEQPA